MQLETGEKKERRENIRAEIVSTGAVMCFTAQPFPLIVVSVLPPVVCVEQSYVNSLNLVVENFVNPLKAEQTLLKLSDEVS